MENPPIYKDDNPSFFFKEVVNDLRGYLKYLEAMGCHGLALSRKTRDMLAGWGGGEAKTETLEEIKENLGDCTRCRLHKGRKNIVFGKGNPDARLVFVGEGPGRDEDLQGEPFVGAAGQLLTRIIQAIGMAREDVYICNIVKCRPPNNRTPLPDEVATCRPFLVRQLKAIRPNVICALGATAAQALLHIKEPITTLRGHIHRYHGISLVPTYHPAFILRNPTRKRDVWEDIQKVQKILSDGLGVYDEEG